MLSKNILELKDGRVPKGFGSRLAFWKAEELHKFAFPASEVIFADLLDDTDFHIWQLSVWMTELVFSKRDGWSHDDVNLFGKLAQRYLVITEEHRGLTSCTVTEHTFYTLLVMLCVFHTLTITGVFLLKGQYEGTLQQSPTLKTLSAPTL